MSESTSTDLKIIRWKVWIVKQDDTLPMQLVMAMDIRQDYKMVVTSESPT